MGYGLKVGYENNGNAITANIFAAKDDVSSLPFVLPESNLTPMQNVAMSVKSRKTFFKRFFIEAEYAVSVLNMDVRSDSEQRDTILHRPSQNLIRRLLPENATSRIFDAINASVGYQGNWYALQLKYERIAPEYQTLGMYFTTSDMRNITIAPSLRLLKSTLNISANMGIQSNNLDQIRTSTTKRKVGSLVLNYAPNELWNLAANYSNFTSYTNIRPQIDPYLRNTLDTLNFYQVSQTMSGTVLRNLGSQERPQSIVINMSYQKASDKASYEGGASKESELITLNISYSYAIVPSNISVAIAGNIYKNSASTIKTTYWGPTLGVTKTLYENTLRASFASTYNETNGSIIVSPVLNNRLSINYTPKPKEVGGRSSQNFALGVNAINRLKNIGEQPKYSEVTGTINYTYVF
jgi:hypothetical protein